MLMKKILLFLLSLCLLISVFPVLISADQTVKVVLNGNLVSFDVPPVIVEGRTLIPLRKISEELGYTVSWDDATRQIDISGGGHLITMIVNDTKVIADGKEIILDVPSMIIDGRTLVPVRFVIDSLGGKVSWDESTYTVDLSAPYAFRFDYGLSDYKNADGEFQIRAPKNFVVLDKNTEFSGIDGNPINVTKFVSEDDQDIVLFVASQLNVGDKIDFNFLFTNLLARLEKAGVPKNASTYESSIDFENKTASHTYTYILNEDGVRKNMVLQYNACVINNNFYEIVSITKLNYYLTSANRLSNWYKTLKYTNAEIIANENKDLYEKIMEEDSGYTLISSAEVKEKLNVEIYHKDGTNYFFDSGKEVTLPGGMEILEVRDLKLADLNNDGKLELYIQFNFDNNVYPCTFISCYNEGEFIPANPFLISGVNMKLEVENDRIKVLDEEGNTVNVILFENGTIKKR